jgi:hypothetical protein
VQIDLDKLQKKRKNKRKVHSLSEHHEPIGPLGLLGAEKNPVGRRVADKSHISSSIADRVLELQLPKSGV